MSGRGTAIAKRTRPAIAICGKWLACDGQRGGISIYNQAIASGYSRLGYSVLFVTARWNRALPVSEEMGVGSRVLRVDVPAIPGRVMRRLRSVGRFVESYLLSHRMLGAMRLLEANGEIQAAEFAEASLDAYHSAGRITVPHFVKCHAPLTLLTTFSPCGYGSAALRLERAIVERAPLLLSPSEDLRTRLRAIFRLEGRAIHVVPNALDYDLYNPALAQPGCSSNQVVLYVGRLEKAKGALALIDAVPQIAQRSRGVRFIFAGENRLSQEEDETLRAVSRRVAAKEISLECHGDLTERELVTRYASATVCVVPSLYYESFSYTAAQAMSCARPVVASRIGGIPEVVEDGVTGLLVPPGDAAAVADATAALLSDPERAKAMGQAGRARVVEFYDPARIARMNLELLGVN